MSKNFENKKIVVAGLVEKFEKASTVVLVDFRGLTVAEDTALRTEFRKAGVEYAVIKNSMIDIAVKDKPFAKEMEEQLKGPTAVAFGYEDMIAPAKIAVEFGKKCKKLTVKCGVCDGAYLDAAGVQALADLPSKEVLIARLMGSMMSAVSGFVRCVEAIRKQKAGEE